MKPIEQLVGGYRLWPTPNDVSKPWLSNYPLLPGPRTRHPPTHPSFRSNIGPSSNVVWSHDGAFAASTATYFRQIEHWTTSAGNTAALFTVQLFHWQVLACHDKDPHFPQAILRIRLLLRQAAEQQGESRTTIACLSSCLSVLSAVCPDACPD